jgi:hypothetical protein
MRRSRARRCPIRPNDGHSLGSSRRELLLKLVRRSAASGSVHAHVRCASCFFKDMGLTAGFERPGHFVAFRLARIAREAELVKGPAGS